MFIPGFVMKKALMQIVPGVAFFLVGRMTVTAALVVTPSALVTAANGAFRETKFSIVPNLPQ